MKQLLLCLATVALCSFSALANSIHSEQVSEASFNYCWQECGTNGLIKARLSSPDISSTAAAGFQLNALCIGSEKGWITREQAANGATLILGTYRDLPRIKGMFSTGYSLTDGSAISHVAGSAGADLQATAGFAAGLLTCAAYFDRDNGIDQPVRDNAMKIYEEMQWKAFLDDKGRLPAYVEGRESNKLDSQNGMSGMLVYLLAIGSPTHGIPAESWNNGWTSTYQFEQSTKGRFIRCPDLQSHLLPFAWIDPRGLQDQSIDYGRSLRLAIESNRDYAMKKMYPQEELWGISSTYGPNGFERYGYPPALGSLSDGILMPSAAVAAAPFLPVEVATLIDVLHKQYPDPGHPYGLPESICPRNKWVSDDASALSRGLVLTQLQNSDSGFIWKLFGSSPPVRRAMSRIAFRINLANFEDPASIRMSPSDGVFVRLIPQGARSGKHALELQTIEGLRRYPLSIDLSGREWGDLRYLSCWVKGEQPPSLSLEDMKGTQHSLRKRTRLKNSDGWDRLYFDLPMLDFPAQRLFIHAPPGKGRWLLDDIALVQKRLTSAPTPPALLGLKATRMPGEYLLQWKPGNPTARCHFVKSNNKIDSEKDFQNGRSIGSTTADKGLLHISDLQPGMRYHFAGILKDADGNRSALSNDVSLMTPMTSRPERFMLEDFEIPPKTKWSASSNAIRAKFINTASLEGARCMEITYNKKGPEDRWIYAAMQPDVRDWSHFQRLELWAAGYAKLLLRFVDGNGVIEDSKMLSVEQTNGWAPLTVRLTDLKKINRNDIRKVLIFVEPEESMLRGNVFLDSFLLQR